MRISHLLLVISVLVFSQTNMNAQDVRGTCGTSRATLDKITGHLHENLAYLAEHPVDLRSGAITYVPIKFHIVKKNDGTGGVEIYKVLDMLCGLNEVYAPMDIQFYMKGGINSFNSSVAYDDPRSDAGILVLKSKRFKAYMNVFLTNQTGEANVLGYYTNDSPNYDIDAIVIRRDQIQSNAETMEHEAGHYFSLLHPFNGWECEEWDASLHGNPTNLTIAPCNSLKAPNNNVLVEFADGSNASNAGDFLSDTPADYNLGLGWPNCSYAGGCKDSKGVLLNPDEENYMGYFSFCTDYHFSTMQKNVAVAEMNVRKGLNSTNNRYINCNSTPELAKAGPSAPFFPSNNGYSNGISNVKLEWTAGPGAASYIIRIDRLTSFGFQPHYYYTTQPEVTLDFTLSDGKTYYWQVWPYNEYDTCEDWGQIFQFTAGMSSSVQELVGLTSIKVIPNPVVAHQPLTVQFNVEQDLEVRIDLFDLSGKLVHTQSGLNLLPGSYPVVLLPASPAPGVYLLRLQNHQGVHTERVIIQE
ncbi:MAG: T9SS type A sorting domain-containing protein [Saprospiraceae bacterium]|nr:T9SS type A sorting domain-containing protein [Saprospiraceae bacterium]